MLNSFMVKPLSLFLVARLQRSLALMAVFISSAIACPERVRCTSCKKSPFYTIPGVFAPGHIVRFPALPSRRRFLFCPEPGKTKSLPPYKTSCTRTGLKSLKPAVPPCLPASRCSSANQRTGRLCGAPTCPLLCNGSTRQRILSARPAALRRSPRPQRPICCPALCPFPASGLSVSALCSVISASSV